MFSEVKPFFYLLRDEIIQGMESTIRDYNKLITYYSKLSSTTSQHDDLYDPAVSTTPTSNRLPALFGDSFRAHSPPSTSSSSLIDSPAFSSLPVSLLTPIVNQNETVNMGEEESSSDVDSCQATVTSLCGLSLSTSKVNKPNTLDLGNLLNNTNKSALTPTLSFTLCPNTPLSETNTPVNDPGGVFIMKKPLDDEEMMNASGRWSLSARKRGAAGAGGGSHQNSRKSKTNRVNFEIIKYFFLLRNLHKFK